MKMAIVGPGAMGCLFAALLARSKSKNEVWLLDKNPDRARKINASGITVEGVSNFKQDVKATADAKDIGHCELVIIFTKSFDTDKALRSIKPLLSDTTNVLTLQNGIGNMQLISELVGEPRAVGGFTSHGSTLIDTGKVRHAGKGETIIGKADGRIFQDIRQIASVLSDAGIATKVSKEINGVIWSKLIINAGINALASVCRFPNGSLLEDEGTKEILRQAVSEATKVARRQKVKLIYDDMLQKAESVCMATSDNICSMLADIIKGKRTEIDYINGAILRQGKSCGIKTPVNEILTQMIKAIESNHAKIVRQ